MTTAVPTAAPLAKASTGTNAAATPRRRMDPMRKVPLAGGLLPSHHRRRPR